MSEEPRGVATNGIGQKTTAHLNLTKDLSSFIAREQRQARLLHQANKTRKEMRR